MELSALTYFPYGTGHKGICKKKKFLGNTFQYLDTLMYMYTFLSTESLSIKWFTHGFAYKIIINIQKNFGLGQKTLEIVNT